jgi:small-conductance mechanosensitive channel
MTQVITNDLMHEVLKNVQADVAHMREDHGQHLVSLRAQVYNMNLSLQTQIHALQGDILRIDKRFARIERHPELTDA